MNCATTRLLSGRITRSPQKDIKKKYLGRRSDKRCIQISIILDHLRNPNTKGTQPMQSVGIYLELQNRKIGNHPLSKEKHGNIDRFMVLSMFSFSSRRVSQKESSHYEVFEKRGLRSALKPGKCISNNPLLGEEEKSLRLRLSGNGDQLISKEY